MKQQLVAFILFALISSHCATVASLKLECRSNIDCSPGYCCAMQPGKWSTPSCHLLREEGAMCRPGSDTPDNLTVSYPDGTEADLSVHYVICPCIDSCVCDRGTCTTRDHELPSNNFLVERNDE